MFRVVALVATVASLLTSAAAQGPSEVCLMALKTLGECVVAGPGYPNEFDYACCLQSHDAIAACGGNEAYLNVGANIVAKMQSTGLDASASIGLTHLALSEGFFRCPQPEAPCRAAAENQVSCINGDSTPMGTVEPSSPCCPRVADLFLACRGVESTTFYEGLTMNNPGLVNEYNQRCPQFPMNLCAAATQAAVRCVRRQEEWAPFASVGGPEICCGMVGRQQRICGERDISGLFTTTDYSADQYRAETASCHSGGDDDCGGRVDGVFFFKPAYLGEYHPGYLVRWCDSPDCASSTLTGTNLVVVRDFNHETTEVLDGHCMSEGGPEH